MGKDPQDHHTSDQVRWSWAFCYGMKRCSNISANSPSKQQGGRHIIVIPAMGSVDRVITLGGGGGGVRKPETGIIY